MARITIEDCLKQGVENQFELVLVAAKRARLRRPIVGSRRSSEGGQGGIHGGEYARRTDLDHRGVIHNPLRTVSYLRDKVRSRGGLR